MFLIHIDMILYILNYGHMGTKDSYLNISLCCNRTKQSSLCFLLSFNVEMGNFIWCGPL